MLTALLSRALHLLNPMAILLFCSDKRGAFMCSVLFFVAAATLELVNLWLDVLALVKLLTY